MVIGAARDATAATRIAAELRAFGFPSEVRRVLSAPDAAEGERALREGASAIVQVDGRAARTEVAIADPTGRTLRVREVLQGKTTAIDALLITRTVELVRATLLASPPAPTAPATASESAAPPAAARPTSTAPPSATATARPAPAAPTAFSGISSSGPTAAPAPSPATASSSPISSSSSAPSPPPAPPAVEGDAGPVAPVERGETRWRAAVSAGVSAASGGLAPEVVLGVQLAARVAGPVHVELLGVAPLTSSPTSTLAGTSRSTAWVFGGGVGARWRRPRIALDAGAGALAIWLRSVGSVPAPTPESPVPNTDGGLGAAAYARGGASLALGRALGRPLAARVDILAGNVFRRPVLRFGETGEPAAWGPAFMVALAGMELHW